MFGEEEALAGEDLLVENIALRLRGPVEQRVWDDFAGVFVTVELVEYLDNGWVRIRWPDTPALRQERLRDLYD